MLSEPLNVVESDLHSSLLAILWHSEKPWRTTLSRRCSQSLLSVKTGLFNALKLPLGRQYRGRQGGKTWPLRYLILRRRHNWFCRQWSSPHLLKIIVVKAASPHFQHLSDLLISKSSILLLEWPSKFRSVVGKEGLIFALSRTLKLVRSLLVFAEIYNALVYEWAEMPLCSSLKRIVWISACCGRRGISRVSWVGWHSRSELSVCSSGWGLPRLIIIRLHSVIDRVMRIDCRRDV